MLIHVVFKLSLRYKAFIAVRIFTEKRFFAGMNPHVSFEVRFFSESFAANVTWIWSDSIVDIHVNF